MKTPMLPSVRSTLSAFLAVSTLCRAQSNQLFRWEFTDGAPTSLPVCQSLPITVQPFSAATSVSGTPPYYMLAFAVDGTPTTSLIGTSGSNVRWVVNQPVGTRVMLNVVDSTGSSGGIPPSLYTVSSGESTACLPDSSGDSTFAVTANVTEEISTCQAWGLVIEGGTAPFNVVIAALDSPSVTNVTIPAGDNLYTYINRANPKGTLLAAISDASGKWARGTPFVTTIGSSETECSGLVSSSGKFTASPKSETDGEKKENENENPDKPKSQTPVIVGVCVGLGVLLLLGGALAFLFLRRRKSQKDLASGMDLAPRKFEETSPQVLSPSVPPTPGSPGSPAARSKFSPPSDSFSTSSAAVTRFTASTPFSPSSVSGSSDDRPTASSGSTHPTSAPSSDGRSTKALEAGFSSEASYLSNTQAQARQRSLPDIPPSRTEESRLPADAGRPDGGVFRLSETPGPGEIVFQHRDAGVIRELPPPYVPRSQPSLP